MGGCSLCSSSLLFFVFSFGCIHALPYKPYSVKVAAIGPWSLDPTANFMAQFNFTNFFCYYLNNQTEILPNASIELIKADTDTKAGTAIKVTTDMVEQDVIAFLGGARTPQQEIVSYVANAFEILHVGGIVTGAILSDKTVYPYFMRTSLADQFVCNVMLQFMLNNKWREVVLINQNDDYGLGNRNWFLELALQNNVSVYTPTQVATGQTDYTQVINQIVFSQIRILVVLLEINEAITMLNAVKRDGRLVNQNYVFLLGQVYFSAIQLNSINVTYPAFDGTIAFISAAVDTPMSQAVWAAWLAANQTEYPGSRIGPLSRSFWFLAEGLLAIAKGLQSYMDLYPNTNVSTINGTILYNLARKLNYTGVSGEVQFDENGDRLALCNIYNVRQSDPNQYDSKLANITLVQQYSPFTKTFTTYSTVSFFNGTLATPRAATCPCKQGTCRTLSNQCTCERHWGGDKCDVFIGKNNKKDMIIAIVVPAFILIAGLISAFFIYKRKRALYVKEIRNKQRSDIPRASVVLGKRIGRGASGEVYSATFRGTEVAVKILSAKNLSISALHQFQLETAIMTGLRHPNIILFMGSCYDKTKEEFLLVMEMMSRGSLFDVLYNKNISLSIELQLHLAYQIVQGINFLHQSIPPIIHCDIKSHNVLLDEKWNCRICDFGITIFNPSQKRVVAGEPLGTVYWTAPEVLLGGGHTIQSDCYSVGILLWEIFHRHLPYEGKDPLSVALEVANYGARPTIGPQVPGPIVDLITSCWAQEPDDRPPIQEIVYILRDLAIEQPMAAYSSEDSPIVAPTGNIVFVYTDMVESAAMWNNAPKSMQQTIKQHNTLLRALLENYKGYEVSFKDHSFCTAFAKMTDAVNWCISVQSAFVCTTWPAAILALPFSSHGMDSLGHVLWNGPRLKMAIHKGVPQCSLDKVTHKMCYSGPVVQRAEKLLESVEGGSVIITSEAYEALDYTRLERVIFVQKFKEEVTESGHETTYLIVPKELEERLSLPNKAQSRESLPYAVIDGNSAPGNIPARGLTKSASKSKEKWTISFDELTLKEQIGVGVGAEVHSATYKGNDVAVKLLINQNFSEENNFTLRYLASTLSKIRHPNVVRFIGMCLEPPNICMVMELMELNLAKYYSANAFPYSEKIRIALQVALGMDYLSKCGEDYNVSLRLNSNNILISKNGDVKISDFAINKLYDSNRTLTSGNAVAWTAPELLNGNARVSGAVDVYSFGVVLWEMAARKRPYLTIHPIRLLNMVAKGYRPDIPYDCPPLYSTLMQECWDSTPGARPSWETIQDKLRAMFL